MNITIYGKPIAKARPRFFRRGRHVGTYSAQVTEEGRWLLDARPQVTKRIEGEVYLTCHFFFDFPSSMPKKHRPTAKHIKKPDLDNLIKFVKDCLNGIAWYDDSQVVYIEAFKEYARCPAGARTEITILDEPSHASR